MQSKVKLAFVISNLSVGGAQKVVLDLVKAVDSTRFEVKLFVHHKPLGNHFERELSALCIPVVYIIPTAHNPVRMYLDLARELNKFAPDVLHIHLDTMFAPLWAWIHKKRALYTIHSQPHRTFNKPILKAFHRFLAKTKRYCITAVSDTIAKETECLLRLPKNCVKVVYNPVAVPEKRCFKIRNEIGFVNVARFQPVKNHKLLIQAFEMVCRESSAAKLTIAGNGELLDECKSYAQDLNIADRVEFLGEVQDVFGLLKEQDVFVLSSDSEALPISILEAMAHGMPIIATAVGGVPDIVRENGILVPAKNAEALAAAMLSLIDSPDNRGRMGASSYDQIQQFTTATIMKKYEALYVREII